MISLFEDPEQVQQVAAWVGDWHGYVVQLLDANGSPIDITTGTLSATGIPHFDNKWRIEETVRGLRFPSHVILRPVFFMENLVAPYTLQGSTLAVALGPSTKLQMIAVDDIGWFGARAFTDAAALNRREIDLAGDVRTMPEAAEILAEALGRPIAFAQTPKAWRNEPAIGR